MTSLSYDDSDALAPQESRQFSESDLCLSVFMPPIVLDEANIRLRHERTALRPIENLTEWQFMDMAISSTASIETDALALAATPFPKDSFRPISIEGSLLFASSDFLSAIDAVDNGIADEFWNALTTTDHLEAGLIPSLLIGKWPFNVLSSK